MRILKDVRFILAVILVLSWVAAGLFFYFYKTDADTKMSVKVQEVEQLQIEINNIGELVPAYIVATDIPSGKQITEEDLIIVEVPISIADNLVYDMDEIIGKFFKLGMTAGTVVTYDCVYDEKLSDDLRLFDIVTHYNPIGIQPGTFIDIRITMPNGQDYIAISHRRLISEKAGVLKVAVSEKDIHTYKSMLLDTVLWGEDSETSSGLPVGAHIYAVEYVEGGVQKSADDYYPLESQILALAQKDPNISTEFRSDIVARRELFEQSLAISGLKKLTLGSIGTELERAKLSIIMAHTQAQNQVDLERELYAQEQALLGE